MPTLPWHQRVKEESILCRITATETCLFNSSNKTLGKQQRQQKADVKVNQVNWTIVHDVKAA